MLWVEKLATRPAEDARSNTEHSIWTLYDKNRRVLYNLKPSIQFQTDTPF